MSLVGCELSSGVGFATESRLVVGVWGYTPSLGGFAVGFRGFTPSLGVFSVGFWGFKPMIVGFCGGFKRFTAAALLHSF